MSPARRVVILVAEDDDDDFLLTRHALTEARLSNDVRRVHDGEELLDYLNRRARWTQPADSPTPTLILLDLNMPRMDGREALRAIKADSALRQIPVVVLTTSRAEEDVVRSYATGVNSFIAKPVTFAALVEAMKVMGRYWFEIVDLPEPPGEPAP
jgi:CheY-like chemotaxis protein